MQNEHSQYYANEKDATEYQLKIIVFIIALYGCFASFAYGLITFWWMAIITSVLVTRWMIAFHELFHLKKADELDLVNRLIPIPFSPLNLGYREYREIHFGHHKHTATESDPDAFHILGGPFKAFYGALTQHEQASYRYIQNHGLTNELAIMMLVRFAIFSVLLIAFPWAFLAWFIVLRATYIVNDFVFFHLVHYRSGRTGTFPIPLPALLRYPLLLIYGIDVVYGTMHHDIHHQSPRIAAKHLPKLASQINK